MRILTTKLNRMAHKKVIVKLLELAQELNKTDKQIACSMIVNDMEKLIDSYVTKQLNLHSVVKTKRSEVPVCRTCNGTGLVYIDEKIKNTLCPDC